MVTQKEEIRKLWGGREAKAIKKQLPRQEGGREKGTQKRKGNTRSRWQVVLDEALFWLDKSSLCGGKIINIYDSGCLTKKFILTERTFLPTKSKRSVIVREIALILVELSVQHQRQVSHGNRLKSVLRATRGVSSQSLSSCISFVVPVFFCVVLYKMSFITDFIALAWGKVKREQPGHLSSSVYVLASTGPMDR